MRKPRRWSWRRPRKNLVPMENPNSRPSNRRRQVRRRRARRHLPQPHHRIRHRPRRPLHRDPLLLPQHPHHIRRRPRHPQLRRILHLRPRLRQRPRLTRRSLRLDPRWCNLRRESAGEKDRHPLRNRPQAEPRQRKQLLLQGPSKLRPLRRRPRPRSRHLRAAPTPWHRTQLRPRLLLLLQPAVNRPEALRWRVARRPL